MLKINRTKFNLQNFNRLKSLVVKNFSKAIMGRINIPENASSGCKWRFTVVNRRVQNYTQNFQAAEKKRGYSSEPAAPPAFATVLPPL